MTRTSNSNMTSCQDFRRFLDEWEGEAEPAAGLDEHRHNCAACNRAWTTHQQMLRALSAGPLPEFSPRFTERVMARLPLAVPKPRRIEAEAIFMFILFAAGAAAFWLSLETVLAPYFSPEKLSPYLQEAQKFGSHILSLTILKWREMIVSAFGHRFLEQSWQVAFISLVTWLVAKGALVLETWLKRMLR